jgi:hypothetical protein
VSVLKVANDSDFWNAAIIAMPKSAGGVLAPVSRRGLPDLPGRQLPARAPLLHSGPHPVDHDAECRDHGENGHEKAQTTPGMIGVAEAIRIENVGGDPHGGESDGQAGARPGGRSKQRPVPVPTDTPVSPRPGRPGCRR